MRLRLRYLSLILSVLWNTALAEPWLHQTVQPVIARAIPESFRVEDYVGMLQWGPQRIRYMAPGGIITWQAWEDEQAIQIVRQGMALVAEKAVGNPRCNDYFAQMPRSKTFDQIWRGQGQEQIRISYSPGPSGMWRAATYGSSLPFDWTITETTVRLGPESVASALVHEASRTNGVGADFKTAYGAEVACGMRQFILNRTVIETLGWDYIFEK